LPKNFKPVPSIDLHFMKPFRTLLIAALIGLIPFAARAAETKDVESQKALLANADPYLVRVQFHLQFDGSDGPTRQSSGLGRAAAGEMDLNQLIREERPWESGGFVVGKDLVMLTDPMVHPRFVKKITVRKGDLEVEATPAFYVLDRDALILRLSAPLAGIKEPKFKDDAAGPFSAVGYTFYNGEWAATVSGFSASLLKWHGREADVPIQADMLITDKKGNPVGVAIKPFTPAESGWRGSPMTWPMWTPAQMERHLKDLEKSTDSGLVHVTLNFRSPTVASAMASTLRRGFDEDPMESATERNVVGIVIGGSRVLVPLALPPKVTARLERIRVHVGDEVIEGKFTASLKDFGALILTLDKSIGNGVQLSIADLRDHRMKLLLRSEVMVLGEQRSAYFNRERLLWFEMGAKERIFSRLYEDQSGIFLFDQDARLVAVPMALRGNASLDRSSRFDTREMMVPAKYVSEALGDLATSSDPANVPLSEADAGRVAWLGVELQSLDQDLARANNVADQTRDGQTGALVTYVYPGSPASEAGVKTGDILLRVVAPGQAAPIEIRIEEDRSRDMFPWDRLDQLREQFFDRLPSPWPPVDNTVNRVLTELGFGGKFRLEYVSNGVAKSHEFTVTPSPAHYQSANKVKSDTLGLTVKDLTYEVRHYLQRTADQPGVVVSKLEPGGKASIAGIKPYELITHVNDQPVNSVADFERLTAVGGDLRLSIKRMSQGRIVTLRSGN
jgi:S1-C subfamily serine protease